MYSLVHSPQVAAAQCLVKVLNHLNRKMTKVQVLTVPRKLLNRLVKALMMFYKQGKGKLVFCL